MEMITARKNILDGKKLSAEFKAEIAAEVKQMKEAGMKVPHLAAILVGNDGASETYIASKVKTCQEIASEAPDPGRVYFEVRKGTETLDPEAWLKRK